MRDSEAQVQPHFAGKHLGKPVVRVEDNVLLKGDASFADDWPEPRGTCHGAILRSPHAHAEIISIDVSQALRAPGVRAVITGEDIKRHTDPFLIVLRQPMDQWCLAIDRVRFVGESVALVVADDRYQAEDALERIKVEYRPLDAVIDTIEATAPDAPLVHPEVGSNVPSDRNFKYGEPDEAFARADHHVKLTVDYPRNSQTPLEGFVVLAEYLKGESSYDVLSNFQGPFTVHPVISKALRVKGAKLRMRIPAYSGGGFGVKQSIFPYIVLMCVASRVVGHPVKWVEDRLEHLTAALAAPNRVIHCEAAVMNDGTVTGMRFEQLDDYGAYLRPPMPGPLYRQHGIMTGAYKVKNLELTNKVVMTNKTPSGMVRGFGGPQVYFAIERLMRHIADELNLDHLDVIKKNLIPAGSFPYRAPAGALIGSGDYQKTLALAEKDGRLNDLRKQQEKARAEGRLYGIGFAVVVEPAQSNMGYLSTINPVEYRKKAGPKGGNVAYATVNVDPLGAVSANADSLPQGQGHATVISQIVADELGLSPEDITVNMERDTEKDPWSIATGNYSSRFSSATAVAVQKAAIKAREKIALIAAKLLETDAGNLIFSNGQVSDSTNPEKTMRFSRVAGTAHWSPGELPDGMDPGISVTASVSPPEMESPNDQDQINTSLTYGFVFDFCGVEVDRDTGEVRIDRYVTTHDSGNLLNPLIANGQVYGAFGWGVGCALYEEFRYGDDGSFLSGTFADYLCPTACEVPEPEILHITSPSPFTPLGAKGIGEGNCMTTPVCIANAVCDAIGATDLRLPLSPSKVFDLISNEEPEKPENLVKSSRGEERPGSSESKKGINGQDESYIEATPEEVWDALLDPVKLADIIPGCSKLDLVSENNYEAQVTLGVGIVKGQFTAKVKLSELDPPKYLVLSGTLEGPLGSSIGVGRISLQPHDWGTKITYNYEVNVSGKAAAVGGRMLESASKVVFNQFFVRLAKTLVSQDSTPGQSWLTRSWKAILKFLGLRR